MLFRERFLDDVVGLHCLSSHDPFSLGIVGWIRMICKEQKPHRLASLGRVIKVWVSERERYSASKSRRASLSRNIAIPLLLLTRCMLRCVAVALRVVELWMR
ncbi:Uncharacterized protein BM_BM12452, partial [Brugia malayi]